MIPEPRATSYNATFITTASDAGDKHIPRNLALIEGPEIRNSWALFYGFGIWKDPLEKRAR